MDFLLLNKVVIYIYLTNLIFNFYLIIFFRFGVPFGPDHQYACTFRGSQLYTEIAPSGSPHLLGRDG